MRVLITGISGLLGQELTRQMIGMQTFEISGLIRSPITSFNEIRYFRGDILDYPSLQKAMQNVDYVIHTAAMVSFSRKQRSLLYEVNVRGTANLVNVCLENNIKKLVHVSSVAALSKVKKNTHTEGLISINENNQWIDASTNSEYGNSKYLAELEVWRGQAEGLKTAIVNPSVILGEGDWARSSTQLFRYVYRQNRFYTSGYLNYVDVRDVAKAIIQLLQSDVEDSRFILNAGKISYEEFFKRVAASFDVNPPQWKLKKNAIEVLWRLETLRGFLTGSNPLITRETAETAQSNYLFENAKIMQEFGFQFIPIDQTIARVCRFLLNTAIK